MVCCVFRMTLQRYNIFRCVPNFTPRFGAILMKNSSNLLTLGRAHASIALLSLNRNFEHELTAFAVEPAHARQSRCEHHSALA